MSLLRNFQCSEHEHTNRAIGGYLAKVLVFKYAD